ncbi:helix-turn-helix domain-containing protein [Streptomyces sp. PKU-EA00015]|uniref:helix-turn-helix transcriptional regulator n=1 Tax=Streptomyces sp. PKU-EA00015 TaxID=2748326 RepID=UPI0015A3656E|nr:transcriptional regulator [Streptomyces sp. PKU-EA00015]NWF25464.1 helix-turn-helix domain-containing protein [Streptomyces sp. PKU-EA00015]
MTDTPRGASTEAFARRLHELRGGSGRSYGALARRVGVGTATLYRYCSGQTVPLDFAPVERLARLCGCGRDELAELHRLWVLADADRGVRGEAGATEPEAAADGGPGAVASAARATGTSREPSVGAEVCAAAGAPPEAARVPDASAERPAGAAPVDGASPEATAVPAAPLAGAAPGEQEAPEVPRPAGATRVPRRSRRPVLVGASAAALFLLAVLTVLVGFRDLTPGSGDDAPTASRGPGGEPAVSPPSVRPRTSPPGPPSATESQTAGPRPRSGDASGRPGAAAPGRTGGAPTTGTPFAWTVDDHVWRNGCDHTYLLDRDPATAPPPPVQADAASWATSLGAVHGGETQVRITVRGRGAEAVVLESLHVRVVERRAPPEQGAFRTSSGCGGALTPRLFDVDLDASRPVARPVPGNDSGEPIPAVSFPYTVSSSDPESLLVSGRTAGCDCDWYLELRWSSGERGGTVRIDDGGRPFRTSGVRGRPVHDYDYGQGRWVVASDDDSG